MRISANNSVPAPKLLLALLLLVPAVLIVGKSGSLPTGEVFRRWFSFGHLPEVSTQRLQYVLFVPLAATVVVLFRLTLGIRLLGPFRSILIAVAFQFTGILPGLLLLVLIVGLIVAVRPSLHALRLPYFARISIMLSAVSLVMILVILCSHWLDLALGERVAYFPIVVICLTAEGFARTLDKEGSASALWRGSMTALVAVLITLISEQPHVAKLLLEFPELLLTQMGAIIIIARYLNWRLLECLNPPALPPSDSLQISTEPQALDEANEQSQSL